MKFWQSVLDMKWKYIWWIYMVFISGLFFSNIGSPIGLFWLFKGVIYIICFIFAIIRLAKWWDKKSVVLPTVMPTSTSRMNRPPRLRQPKRVDWDRVSKTHSDFATSGTIPKPVRGSHVYTIDNYYINDVDVWRSDLDKNIQKIMTRTEQRVQKIKDRARRIETRNKIKRDEWDTRYFNLD